MSSAAVVILALQGLSLLLGIKSSVLLFFAEKMLETYLCKSFFHFLAKNGSDFAYNTLEIPSLPKDVVSLEQPGGSALSDHLQNG